MNLKKELKKEKKINSTLRHLSPECSRAYKVAKILAGTDMPVKNMILIVKKEYDKCRDANLEITQKNCEMRRV